MKAAIYKLCVWSWVVTLPIALAAGYVGYRVVDRFHTFGVAYVNDPIPFDLVQVTRYEVAALVQRVRAAVNRLGPGGETGSTLKTIQLFSQSSELAKLDKDLPHSGFKYVKAGLLHEGRLLKAKIRYRGDFLYHWAWDKKSFRIKTSKRRLYQGMRAFNLIAPKYEEQLNNFLGYRLAEMMGLMVPRTELIRVVLNGEDRGVHLLVEQFDETTLRRLGKMPADIYRGEMVGKDAFPGSHMTSLFESAVLWDKISVNNHYEAGAKAPLEHLLAQTGRPRDPATHARLGGLMDLENWGRFSAYESLAATFHFWHDHNWRLYYDPWRQKMQPIVWDPVGWGSTWVPAPGRRAHMDVVNSELHRLLFANGDFLRDRQRAFEEFFNSGKAGLFLDFVERTVATMVREVRTDPLLRPGDPERVIAAMWRLHDYIKRVFADLERGFVEPAANAVYVARADGIGLRVQGRKPLWRLRLAFDRPIASIPRVRIRHRGPGGARLVDVSGAVALRGNALVLDAGLLADMVPQDGDHLDLIVRPTTYDILLPPELMAPGRLLSVSSEERGEWVMLKQLTELAETEPTTLFRAAPHRPLLLPEIWRGTVWIEGVREIDRPLVIEPGTQVRMGEGASLILRNRLVVRGTGSAPVRFLPAREGQGPWGTVALLGSGANGSRLTHCEMIGGSGLKGPLFEYSAMFSIHDVRNVQVSACQFRDNQLVDDMVHTVYASVRVETSVFSGAPHDAVDFDISEVSVADSAFLDNGNDSIDLMTTRATVVNSRFARSGDKGISVGEDSRLVAIDTVFEGNAIGVQAKDGSFAALFNADLLDNQKALDAYRKNWRYGRGGTILVSKSKIKNNTKSMAADKRSSIRVFDSFVDARSEGESIALMGAVDDREAEIASTSTFLPAPPTVSEGVRRTLREIAGAALNKRDPRRRGAALKGLPGDV